MDKNWTEMNKEMQALIAKKATFKEGIELLQKAMIQMNGMNTLRMLLR